jgi:hypothetical protein
MHRVSQVFVLLLALRALAVSQEALAEPYRLLATSKTSTLEKEMNEAAEAGYRLAGTMGGEVRNGEIITVMRRLPEQSDKGRYHYRLLATSLTGTMQKELQAAGDAGYEFVGTTARGEVMVILELDRSIKTRPRYEYRLLATSKTSTMQKELNQASSQGFIFLSIIRRGEVLSILRRVASE